MPTDRTTKHRQPDRSPQAEDSKDYESHTGGLRAEPREPSESGSKRPVSVFSMGEPYPVQRLVTDHHQPPTVSHAPVTVTEPPSEPPETITVNGKQTIIRDSANGRFKPGSVPNPAGRGAKRQTVAVLLQEAPAARNRRIANRLLRDAGAGVASAQRMVLEYQDGLPVKRVQVIDEGGPLASLLSSLGEVIDAEVRELPDGESAHNQESTNCQVQIAY